MALASFLTFVIFYTVAYSFNITTPTSFSLFRQFGKSTVYTVDDNGAYDSKPYLAVLQGSHYQVGFDYAVLWKDEIPVIYNAFMNKVLDSKIEIEAIEWFLDWQWDDYLSVQIPTDFADELRGIKDGAVYAGDRMIATYLTRVITIGNLPGDVTSNIEYLLETELIDGRSAHIYRNDVTRMKILRNLLELSKAGKLTGKFWRQKMQCSFYSVWGSRTQGGQLFTMRNLDWLDDSGINAHKLISVYKIDGKVPYATVGFAGVVGALAGMSAAGITVHETGNDVSSPGSSFNGFPWVLRLRYIMENSRSISDAILLWNTTNNTMGMNHQIASAADVVTGHPARALETMSGYTALFMDNDPREKALAYKDANGTVYQLGNPTTEALWRTNHGFDPRFLKSQLLVTQPGDDSQIRYQILSDVFSYYQSINKPIGFFEAVNITSILGDKGSEDFFHCPNAHAGINILSVTFVPDAGGNGEMYVAWGNSTGPSWRPACCNTYIKFSMGKWWLPG